MADGEEPEESSPGESDQGSGTHGDPDRPADHSVLLDGRLVAYVWVSDQPGVLRRAGGDATVESVCAVPFGEVRSFDPRVEIKMAELVPKSKSCDAFLFKLGMEGFVIAAGVEGPSALIRRF